MEDGTI